MVICAGGPRLLRQAWVAVRLLRRAGCELPIELWCACCRSATGHGH